jgi:hypothetical protein
MPSDAGASSAVQQSMPHFFGSGGVRWASRYLHVATPLATHSRLSCVAWSPEPESDKPRRGFERPTHSHLYNVCPNNVSHRSHRGHLSHRRHTLWIPSKRGLMTTHNLQAGHLSFAYRHPQEASERPVQASCRPILPFAPGYPPSIQRRGEASAL